MTIVRVNGDRWKQCPPVRARDWSGPAIVRGDGVTVRFVVVIVEKIVVVVVIVSLVLREREGGWRLEGRGWPSVVGLPHLALLRIGNGRDLFG